MATVELHPLAIREARSARRWYARVSQALALQFMAELDLAIARIGFSPDTYPQHLRGTRLYRFNRFPYLLIYLELTPDRVLVLAVAHQRRLPGYWRRRLPW